MEISLLRFLAQSISSSFTSASRPAATFFVVQCFAAIMVRMGHATLPEALNWLVSFVAIGIAATLAGLELIVQHEDGLTEILRDLKMDHIFGALGTFSASLMFASLGLPESEVRELVGVASDASREFTTAIQESNKVGYSTSQQMVAIGSAVLLNTGLTWGRGKINKVMDDFNLESIWQRIETGSVVGLLIVIIFLPVVALVIVAFMTLALFVMGVVISKAQARIDQHSRISCPQCGYELRVEAHRCPECHSPVIPTLNVGVTMSIGDRIEMMKKDISGISP